METEGRAQRPPAAADRAVDTRRRSAARSRSRPSCRRRPATTCRARSAPATTASSARTSSAVTSTARCCSSSSRATASGTMVAAAPLAHMRNATIDDVGGILADHRAARGAGHPRPPLARAARDGDRALRRRRARQRDHRLRRLYAFLDEKVGELAALAVHPDFRREGYGEALMSEIEARARKLKLTDAVRADDADVAMVPRARLPHGDDRRPPASRSRRSTITSASRRSTARISREHQSRHGAHGPMHQARPRGRRARFPALSGRARQADLRERVEGSVAGVAQAPDDARQRESPVARRRRARANGSPSRWSSTSSAPAPRCRPATCRRNPDARTADGITRIPTTLRRSGSRSGPAAMVARPGSHTTSVARSSQFRACRSRLSWLGPLPSCGSSRSSGTSWPVSA